MRLFAIIHVLGIILLIHCSQAHKNPNKKETPAPKEETSEEANKNANANKYLKYMEILNNCTVENNITVVIYAYASKTNNTDNIYEKSKCVDACMFRTLEIMKEDGTVDINKALEHLLSGRPGIQRDTMKKNIESCSLKKSEDKCETAHDLMNCALGYY